MDTPQDPLNDASLQEKLKQYEAAFRQEFELAEKADPQSLDTIRQNTATKLLQAVPSAVERILYLMEHGEKDSTQLAAAKFIIANALGKESIGETSDPLANLLAELTKEKRETNAE